MRIKTQDGSLHRLDILFTHLNPSVGMWPFLADCEQGLPGLGHITHITNTHLRHMAEPNSSSSQEPTPSCQCFWDRAPQFFNGFSTAKFKVYLDPSWQQVTWGQEVGRGVDSHPGWFPREPCGAVAPPGGAAGATGSGPGTECTEGLGAGRSEWGTTGFSAALWQLLLKIKIVANDLVQGKEEKVSNILS